MEKYENIGTCIFGVWKGQLSGFQLDEGMFSFKLFGCVSTEVIWIILIVYTTVYT